MIPWSHRLIYLALGAFLVWGIVLHPLWRHAFPAPAPIAQTTVAPSVTPPVVKTTVAPDVTPPAVAPEIQPPPARPAQHRGKRPALKPPAHPKP